MFKFWLKDYINAESCKIVEYMPVCGVDTRDGYNILGKFKEPEQRIFKPFSEIGSSFCACSSYESLLKRVKMHWKYFIQYLLLCK